MMSVEQIADKAMHKHNYKEMYYKWCENSDNGYYEKGE
jgi:hypothetical protein